MTVYLKGLPYTDMETFSVCINIFCNVVQEENKNILYHPKNPKCLMMK